MAIGDNPYSIDTDYSATTGDFAATSSRVGTAVGATQAGRAVLFRGPTGAFSLAAVDASGSQMVQVVSPAGASLQVYTGQAAPASTSQYGTLVMGRQNVSTANYQPLAIDAQGYLLTAGAGKPSFRAYATGVTCAQSKVLLSIYNGGSNFLRLADIGIYVQVQSQTATNSGTVLGLTGTTTSIPYYPLYCEMYRISSHTKSSATTTISPVACDSADTMDSAVTCYSGSTTSASLGLLHRRDALQATNSGVEWYRVICQTEKNILCRPGEGISIVCVSNGQIGSGSSTTAATVDVQAIFSLSAG